MRGIRRRSTIAKRWTVLRDRNVPRDGKRWRVYPPGFKLGGFVNANRRFATWEQAHLYVAEERNKIAGVA